jgi:hypothetical protein
MSLHLNEYKHISKDESWEDVFPSEGVNNSFHKFSVILWYHVTTVFPFRKSVVPNKPENTWITNGINNSMNRMCFLNRLKKTIPPIEYISALHRYQTICRKGWK